jgi:phage terminase small subunit
MALDDCVLAPRLDPVRERFAQEYHATGNASEAYRRANPKARTSRPSADRLTSDILAYPRGVRRPHQLGRQTRAIAEGSER